MLGGSPEPDDATGFRMLFVCTGNICRSPMAEVIMRRLVEQAGLSGVMRVNSAATGDWHVGEPADPRAVAALAERGYDGSRHRARQFDPAAFESHDLIVVFDRSQERILHGWAPTELARSKVQLLLGFDPAQAAVRHVPDPYYSDPETFDAVLLMIEQATRALFRQLAPALRASS